MMADQDERAQWMLESSQAIQMKLDELERIQRIQLNEIRNELKSISWMANLCAFAALIYIGKEIYRWLH
jgi:hypothetical protein